MRSRTYTRPLIREPINEKLALDGLSLTLKEGDFVTVIGGNGAGKSTMLNAVAGTWLVDEGQILIDGIDVTKLPEAQESRLSWPCVPGSHDRNRSHYGDRRKSCAGETPG